MEKREVPVTEKKITLPPKEEMLSKLIGVDNNIRLQEVFYPSLLKRAGKEMGPYGYAQMFNIALGELSKQFEKQEVVSVVRAEVASFVDALIDDKEFADWVKKNIQ